MSTLKPQDEQFDYVVLETEANMEQETGPKSAVPNSVESPSAVKVYPSATENINCMTLSSDEKTLFTGQAGGPVKLWDVETGQYKL